MKLPKKARTWIKETDNVINKVMRVIEDKEEVEKQDFEKVMDLVIEQISKNMRNCTRHSWQRNRSSC